jgi:hypothetical protein
MLFDMLQNLSAGMPAPRVTQTVVDIPQPVLHLAEALSRRHGAVQVTKEKNGFHLNMACPNCLTTEGARELQAGKRHLAVNADKYLSSGKWTGEPAVDMAASCMKCSTPYRITKLLQFPPLSKRGYSDSPRVTVTDNTKWLVHRNGRDIPGGPGVDTDRKGVIPLTQLPPDHPAIWYLQSRGYSIASLCEQFDASYCDEEWAECREEGRYHKHLLAGMKDSHQGRIVFFSFQNGAQVGYQGRIIENVFEAAGQVYRAFWCGQARNWKTLEYRSPDGTWILLPEFRSDKGAWPPSKYKNASGAMRNELLFGLDAAVAWNAKHRAGLEPYAIVVEGPLDAGKLGPPAIARIGKYLSDEQIKLLASRFRRVFLVPDNDKAGLHSITEDQQRLAAHVHCDIVRVPDVCPFTRTKLKDPGEMSAACASAFKQHMETLL